MTYRVVQPQKNKNGERYYLYEVSGVWDPEKKNSKQKRKYLGACDKDGNLLKTPVKKNTVIRSPSYGPYYLMKDIVNKSGLLELLKRIYDESTAKKLIALAILGVTDPCSTHLLEEAVADTYVRELLDLDWSMEQSEVCRFVQTVGEDAGRREEVFKSLAPKNGCVIFDIVCLKIDSEHLEFSEKGRKMHLTGSKQYNLGMIHSMSDNLPFCYRTYPGSVADVVTLDNIVTDLKRIGCTDFEIVMDRGFFSTRNIAMMAERSSGFTVPVPAKYDIEKALISESVGVIESPLNTDYLGGTVRGYDTKVVLDDNKFRRATETDTETIRAVVFQDDSTRRNEIDTLYESISMMEYNYRDKDYDQSERSKLTLKEQRYFDLFDVSEGDDGKFRLARKRNAISAKENACGRFAVMTTSTLPWKELLIEYRQRNEVEYDFGLLQSDLFNGVKGKSERDSAEGGLFINFLSLRLRLMLIDRMKRSGLVNEMWTPQLFLLLKKLRISYIGGEWRLNEVTKTQRETFEKLEVQPPTGA